MAALLQDRYGPPQTALRFDQVERPKPGPTDVLVKMRATSINSPDWLAVTGIPYAVRPSLGLLRPTTQVRGTDIAGVIEEVGASVEEFEPGDPVLGSLWDANQRSHPPGTFAEYTVVTATRIIKKPDSITWQEAGSSPLSGLTALAAIRHVADVQPGQHVLINGASGGVGTMAIQIAKAYDANVTAVCSSRNVELVESLGADHVIDYTRHDFTKGRARYDIILDNVMNRAPSATTRVLNNDGLFLPNSVGNTGRWFGGLPRMGRAGLLGLASRKRVKFVTCEVDSTRLTELADLVTTGNVRTVIDSVFSLQDGPDAIERMLSHRASGQVVISMTD